MQIDTKPKKKREKVLVSFKIRLTVFIMETIDLIMFISYCTVVLPLGVVVNRKLYKNIKNEEHRDKGKVVQYIMKTYSLVQCIAWPAMAVFTGVFFLLDVVFEIMECSVLRYYIGSLRFVYILIRDYLGFNSLIVAIVRYVFLVFDKQAESFGVNKLKTLFISSSISVPILCVILYELTHPVKQDYISFFVSEIQDENTYSNITSSAENCSNNTYNSPMYVIFNSNAPQALVTLMSAASDAMIIVIFSNLIEGCIYTHLFIMHGR
jgi:hypothetical protein